MNNKEFGEKLEVRTKVFAIQVIKLSGSLPQSNEFKVISYQITKSGTSIGANYREANRSRSKADFANKIKICEAEASETLYWLEILSDLKQINTDHGVVKEAKEILAIFTSIASKLKL
ncbi:MAG: four helix bundle protein [Bacteroidales bacterium]|nr:four helix bundle protein [Bacteroidales bacterium]